MTARLGKDERAKLIAEFEAGKESSNPNYYCVKDKNGKVMVRRNKVKEVKSPEEAEYIKVKKSLATVNEYMTKVGSLFPHETAPTPAPEQPVTHQKEPKAKLL